MYDGKTQLLIDNPINRYLINSPMLPAMKKNADGSLTLLHPEGFARQGQGSQLAARAGWPDLHGDAPVLAEGHAAVDPAARRGQLEAAGGDAGAMMNGVPVSFPDQRSSRFAISILPHSTHRKI